MLIRYVNQLETSQQQYVAQVNELKERLAIELTRHQLTKNGIYITPVLVLFSCSAKQSNNNKQSNKIKLLFFV